MDHCGQIDLEMHENFCSFIKIETLLILDGELYISEQLWSI